MGRTGEAVKRLTRTGFNPSWSPDGNRIVFATENIQLAPMNREGKSALWTVDVRTEETQRLNEGDAVQPNWSPHNHRIAYAALLSAGPGKPRQLHIRTMPTGGGESTAITSGAGIECSPIWSPDGKHLYYASNRGGSMNLWRVPIDEASGNTTGEPEAIVTPATYLAHPSISADGKRIAYVNKLETLNIQRISFDPVTEKRMGEPEWITTGSRSWSLPDPSPDGKRLVFYSLTQPESKLYVMRTDKTGLNRLTPDNASDRVARWSPNGDWITFTSNRSGPLFQLW